MPRNSSRLKVAHLRRSAWPREHEMRSARGRAGAACGRSAGRARATAGRQRRRRIVAPACGRRRRSFGKTVRRRCPWVAEHQCSVGRNRARRRALPGARDATAPAAGSRSSRLTRLRGAATAAVRSSSCRKPRDRAKDAARQDERERLADQLQPARDRHAATLRARRRRREDADRNRIARRRTPPARTARARRSRAACRLLW